MALFSTTTATIKPRDYQQAAHDQTLFLFDRGEPGVLIRSATGTGKTATCCLIMDTWLKRGPDYSAIVLSYEQQLVWQFAEEIEEFLGVTPGIEMGTEAVDCERMPRIIVASRQSLMLAPKPSQELVAELMSLGIADTGPCHARMCEAFAKHLRKGGDAQEVRDEIERMRLRPEADGENWARLHKFSWRKNWLIIFDEAHKYARKHVTTGPLVDWFERNPISRRLGVTATPKRSDNISIGDQLFPGIALDYPLKSPSKPCAVNDGWCVPYRQRYIQVEDVDFKSIGRVKGDFDEAELEAKLGKEETLASLVEPLLDLVGERQTIIFSPGVQMAKDVAGYINARVEVTCPACRHVKWIAADLVYDGVECTKCTREINETNITRIGQHAVAIDGSLTRKERKPVYDKFEKREYQFLSVCGLCREGFNSPGIGCVAIFRPVSKKASSLAEQMKGRGCRPLRGLLKHEMTKEERLKAIADSKKPYCLIIDLVGVTGLEDCASTAQIYAEGLTDEIKKSGATDEEAERIAEQIMARAEQILAEEGMKGEKSVEEAIEEAKKEDEDARKRIKEERERAEAAAREEAHKIAKAQAEVKYSEHDVGYGTNHDPDAASDGQYRFAAFLGMEIKTLRSKKQMGRVISMLRQRMAPAEVARLNRLANDQWEETVPSIKQKKFMAWKKIPTSLAKTPYDASLLIDARMEPEKYVQRIANELQKARNHEELSNVAKDIHLVRGVLSDRLYNELIEAGKRKRGTFGVPVSANASSDYDSIPE